jgi:hypothetical protein
MGSVGAVVVVMGRSLFHLDAVSRAAGNLHVEVHPITGVNDARQRPDDLRDHVALGIESADHDPRSSTVPPLSFRT